MNIELDEVVVQDVSDEALEMAAGGAQGGLTCELTKRDIPSSRAGCTF